MRTNNFLGIIVVIIFGLSLGMLGWVYWFLNSPALSTASQFVDFTVKPGSSFTKVAYELTELKLLKHPRMFTLLAKISGVSKKMRMGEYRFENTDTPIVLLHKLATGEVIIYSVTMVEGTTFQNIMATLAGNPQLIHTLSGLAEDQVMAKIGHEGESSEGKFFPETYNFSKGVKDADVLRDAYNLMQKRLDILWQQRDPTVPYSCPYQALIAASIIEKETAVLQEKPVIAGVIVRRLARGMLLQVDPTVIYGLQGSLKGPLTALDLKKDNPYNTYLYKGLPPTPICMPSSSSIYAALHPDRSNILYYVAKGNGSHDFSETLQQHNAAIDVIKKK